MKADPIGTGSGARGGAAAATAGVTTTTTAAAVAAAALAPQEQHLLRKSSTPSRKACDGAPAVPPAAQSPRRGVVAVAEMKVYVAIGDMGEGTLHAFTSLRAAKTWAAATDNDGGMILPTPPTSVPKADEVWLVVFGDRGCVAGCIGAFVSQEAAESAAVAAEAAADGWSFGVVKVQVEV